MRLRRSGPGQSLVALIATVLVASGCMTLDTRTDPDYPGPRTYSGVRRSSHNLGQAFLGQSLLMFFFLVDLPFSFVADTLLLPLTIPEERARRSEVAAALDVESEVTSVVPAAPHASPLSNAKHLFSACASRWKRLDPTVTDCYAVGARIAFEPEPGAGAALELSGSELKRRIRAALPGLRDEGGFVGLSEPAYSVEGERVRIEAVRASSFERERTRIELLVGPGTDGGWRILEEISTGWP